MLKLRKFPSIPSSFSVFFFSYYEYLLDFLNVTSVSMENLVFFFVLYSINMVQCILIEYVNVKLTLHFWDGSHLIVV